MKIIIIRVKKKYRTSCDIYIDNSCFAFARNCLLAQKFRFDFKIKDRAYNYYFFPQLRYQAVTDGEKTAHDRDGINCVTGSVARLTC